ncbi:hypothetical protein HaLaN_21958 [Haematococcus lacustris]|uniref:Uncharacterized protein n=1 Tax=Haematococcus lacustris TaxID=44745 RepID=A0A699ZSR3_HAELA|nr:hypothetical protein HaLaN_21958 [Haematococcus lacustris]
MACNYIVTKLHVQVDPSEGEAVPSRPVWPQLCLGWRTAGLHVRRLPGHLLLPVFVTQLCAVQRAVGPEPGQLQLQCTTLSCCPASRQLVSHCSLPITALAP